MRRLLQNVATEAEGRSNGEAHDVLTAAQNVGEHVVVHIVSGRPDADVLAEVEVDVVAESVKHNRIGLLKAGTSQHKRDLRRKWVSRMQRRHFMQRPQRRSYEESHRLEMPYVELRDRTIRVGRRARRHLWLADTPEEEYLPPEVRNLGTERLLQSWRQHVGRDDVVAGEDAEVEAHATQLFTFQPNSPLKPFWFKFKLGVLKYPYPHRRRSGHVSLLCEAGEGGQTIRDSMTTV